MKREPVASSMLASVGYDEGLKTLEVEFVEGDVYQYEPVPAEEHRSLMDAASKGTYFAEHIRKGGYEYRKVE